MEKISEKEALRRISEYVGKDNVKIEDDNYMTSDEAFKQEYERRLEMMKPKTEDFACVPEHDPNQPVEINSKTEEVKPIKYNEDENSYPADWSEFEINVWQLTSAMTNLLCYKNKRYGNAALDPIGIFNKHPELGSIPTRIDDKLSRIKNSENFRVNDICDLIGYLYLLLLAMGVKKEDIERLKD